ISSASAARALGAAGPESPTPGAAEDSISNADGSSTANDSSGTAPSFASYDDKARRYEPTFTHSLVRTHNSGSSTARPSRPPIQPGFAARMASAWFARSRKDTASGTGTRYRVTTS